MTEQSAAETAQSHPVWVCGLKLVLPVSGCSPIMSHPVWVCGLKLLSPTRDSDPEGVTPCMGVWIETRSPKMYG